MEQILSPPVTETRPTWRFVGICSDRIGQPVIIGDFVGLVLNDIRGLLLSAGDSGVRSTTTVLGTDEAWVIVAPSPIVP